MLDLSDPDAPIAEEFLSSEDDLRGIVVSPDGTLAAFEIGQYDTVTRDEIGPVMDMFAGKIPVSNGDHILFTDTYLHAAGDPIREEFFSTFRTGEEYVPELDQPAYIGVDGKGRVLFIHCRGYLRMHDLVNALIALPLDLKRLQYAEGGEPAA